MKREKLEFLLTKNKYFQLKEQLKNKEDLFYSLLENELSKYNMSLKNFKNFNDKQIETLVDIEMKIEKRLNLRELRDELRKVEDKIIELMFILLEKETKLPAEIKELKEKFKSDPAVRLITGEKLLKAALDYLPE